jgi:glycoside/pentoside/hexuronide:cation symporter, GPH family
MLRAIVADVADAQRLKTGHDRVGLFFSVFALSDKAGLALAVGIALPLVGALGFTPGHANSAAALFHLKLVFALGPALAHLLSALVIRGFPLDEASHGEGAADLATTAGSPKPAATDPSGPRRRAGRRRGSMVDRPRGARSAASAHASSRTWPWTSV